MENETQADDTITRVAVPGDVPAMLTCDTYAQAHASRSDAVRAATGKGQCLLALHAGQVAGYVLLHHGFFDHGFVPLVVVSPAQRRRGVGLRLLAAAATACQTEKMFTSTNQSNQAAQGLRAQRADRPSRRRRSGTRVRDMVPLTALPPEGVWRGAAKAAMLAPLSIKTAWTYGLPGPQAFPHGLRRRQRLSFPLARGLDATRLG